MNMVELIERLEKATGPDRELDVSIALALGIVKEREGNMLYGAKDFTVLVLESDYYDNGGNPPELWHYTSSIDAALTLVPEGSTSFLLAYWEKKTPPYGAHVGPSLDARADASTPARALCVAALKARASIQETEK